MTQSGNGGEPAISAVRDRQHECCAGAWNRPGRDFS